jgi:Mrp family chromosome partitioning ATPase
MNENKQHTSQEIQNQRIEENLKKIKHRIVVFSGKGGVGKTTVAVNLAYALVQNGAKVGLLDADITGPNVPKMAGIEGFPGVDGKSRTIVPQIKDGLQVMSIAPMIPQDAPVIWRGPLRSGAITQFLSDVIWGELDFLLADLPPGTGDEVLTAAQRMQPQMAVVVTTPQEVSLMDCRRAVNLAKKLNIPIVGVVENMSGLVCPHCDKEIEIFGSGGGEKMADQMGSVFLGRVPMELATRESGDTGKPVVLSNPESIGAKAFITIAKNISAITSKG